MSAGRWTSRRGGTRKTYVAAAILGVACMAGWAGASRAADTASCEGKRSWQRSIVESAIRAWLDQATRPADLLELIQAEQGIAACGPGQGIRLHVTRLPINLVPSQLGAVLLANELEWRGLVPPPEDALRGKFFRVAAPRERPDREQRVREPRGTPR